MVSAAVVTIATVTVAVRPSTLASAQFFLANVRQIPALCGGVRQAVDRQVAPAAAGTAHLAELAGSAPGKALAKLEEVSSAIRDGFHRGLEGGVPGSEIGATDDGARDIRLLMQIGMLLGAVYVAFLTVWFWATRLRWTPRT
jgi:hypothetical protein